MSDEAARKANSQVQQKRRTRQRAAFQSWWMIALGLLGSGLSMMARDRNFLPPRGSPEYLTLHAFTKFAACAPAALLALGGLCIAMLLASRKSQFCHRLTHSLPAFIVMGFVTLALIAAMMRGLFLYIEHMADSPR